jgi:hypothetical protein
MADFQAASHLTAQKAQSFYVVYDAAKVGQAAKEMCVGILLDLSGKRNIALPPQVPVFRQGCKWGLKLGREPFRPLRAYVSDSLPCLPSWSSGEGTPRPIFPEWDTGLWRHTAEGFGESSKRYFRPSKRGGRNCDTFATFGPELTVKMALSTVKIKISIKTVSSTVKTARLRDSPCHILLR